MPTVLRGPGRLVPSGWETPHPASDCPASPEHCAPASRGDTTGNSAPRINDSDPAPVGNPGRPRRFDTRFFIAAAPESQRGSHDEQETVDSIWITPQEALERHAAKEFDLMNVTRIQLEALAQSPTKAALLEMSANKQRFSTMRPVLPKKSKR